MEAQRVTLRKMTPSEYGVATENREAEIARELSRSMPREVARERARRSTAQFLPDGLDTAGHHLLVAENGSGEVVGNAWIGLDPRQAADLTSSAWLYDIHVLAPFRRRGYGSAILTAVEELAAQEGMMSLDLNVFGGNEAAISLYERNGYAVSSMHLSKRVRR